MSSIRIDQAKRMYGGETEEETLRNLAKAHGCRRIYKYAADYGDKKTHTDYKVVQEAGDIDEQNLFRAAARRSLHNVVLVYDDGRVTLPGG